MAELNQFINGQWLAGQGALLKSIDPAKNQVIWQGKTASPEQVESAVNAARHSQFAWYMSGLEQRMAIIKQFASLLETHKEELALLIATETGKPLWETRTEIAAMIGKVAISEKAY